MTDAFISRKSAVWLGKESVAGTSVAADVRIPKTGWVLNPEFEEAVDDSGYGVIDEVYDTQTTKNFSKISLGGIARDDFLGYLLLGALGTSTEVLCATLPAPSGGTPARSDSVYVTTATTLDNAAAVDKAGSPNKVEIPINNHIYADWDTVTIAGTTNYNGTFVVSNVVALTSIEIESAYNAETFGWTETITGSTFTGTIKKITSMGVTPTTYYWISTTTGTLADSQTLTDGTWTSTAGITATAAAKGHFFERANTNAHQSFTLYDDDPVAAVKSVYSMINTFELSVEVGDYVKFTAEFRGKKMESGGSLSPAYSDENPFLASMSNVYFAANEAALNAATASCMQNFRLSINKNLTDIQCFGSQDIDSLHNQQFTTEWDFEALYTDATLRDYVIDSDKKAARFEVINDEATALIALQIFPSILCDFSKVGFKEWTKTDANNDIVKQTMWYSGQYDNATSMQVEILLINDNNTGY